MKQVLSDEQRKDIRSNVYLPHSDAQMINYKNAKIKKFCELVKGKKVLDLGSVDHLADNYKSPVWLFKALAANAKSLVGLDYYKDGVKVLSDLGFNIVYGDAQNFSFDEKFEVITAGDLIEHIPNLHGFLSCSYEALEEGGEMIISTPNPWCWKYISYHCFKKELAPINEEHVAWFCLRTLKLLFSRYGFEYGSHLYSSYRAYENFMPLPPHIKHTTLSVVFRKPCL